MPKTMRKTSLKIQMLAGISLNVCPDSGSQKKLPLEVFKYLYQRRGSYPGKYISGKSFGDAVIKSTKQSLKNFLKI